MARTPGVVPLPEPTYRTREEGWVSFDTVVERVTRTLGDVSPVVVRAVVQISRHSVKDLVRVDLAALADEVAHVLRHERVVVGPTLVARVLRAYVAQVDDLDVVQVSEA